MKPGWSIHTPGGPPLQPTGVGLKVPIRVLTLRQILLDEIEVGRAATAAGITVEQLRVALEALASD